MLYCRSNILQVLDRALSQMIPHLCLCFLQSCNKSLINQACSGPYWGNIGPWSFLYGPRCARSILSRPRADILPVRPSRLVNKIYIHLGGERHCESIHVVSCLRTQHNVPRQGTSQLSLETSAQTIRALCPCSYMFSNTCWQLLLSSLVTGPCKKHKPIFYGVQHQYLPSVLTSTVPL